MEESHTEDSRIYHLYVKHRIFYPSGTRIELQKIFVLSLKKNTTILTLDQKYRVLSLFLE